MYYRLYHHHEISEIIDQGMKKCPPYSAYTYAKYIHTNYVYLVMHMLRIYKHHMKGLSSSTCRSCSSDIT